MPDKDKKYGKVNWQSIIDVSQLNNKILRSNGKTDQQTISEVLTVLENTPEGQALFSEIKNEVGSDVEYPTGTMPAHKVALLSLNNNSQLPGSIAVNLAQIERIINLSKDGSKRTTVEQVLAHELRHKVFDDWRDSDLPDKYRSKDYLESLGKELEKTKQDNPDIAKELAAIELAKGKVHDFITNYREKKGISKDDFSDFLLNESELKELNELRQPFYKSMNNLKTLGPDFFDKMILKEILESNTPKYESEERSMDIEILLANRFKINNIREGHYDNSWGIKSNKLLRITDEDIKEKIKYDYPMSDERKTYIDNLDKAWNKVFDPKKDNAVISAINKIDDFANDRKITPKELVEIRKILNDLKNKHGVETEINTKHNYIQIAYDYKKVELEFSK